MTDQPDTRERPRFCFRCGDPAEPGWQLCHVHKLGVMWSHELEMGFGIEPPARLCSHGLPHPPEPPHNLEPEGW